jgi:hypothetical protein
MSSIDLAWLRPRAVVMNKAPAAVLDHDGREIRPRGGVTQRPFRKRDPVRRRAHCGVVPVGAEDLPRRPSLEANEHLLLSCWRAARRETPHGPDVLPLSPSLSVTDKRCRCCTTAASPKRPASKSSSPAWVRLLPRPARRGISVRAVRGCSSTNTPQRCEVPLDLAAFTLHRASSSPASEPRGSLAAHHRGVCATSGSTRSSRATSEDPLHRVEQAGT